MSESPFLCCDINTSWLKEVVTKSELENTPMETIQDNKVRYDNTDFVTTLMNQQARTVVLEMEGIKYDHSI